MCFHEIYEFGSRVTHHELFTKARTGLECFASNNCVVMITTRVVMVTTRVVMVTTRVVMVTTRVTIATIFLYFLIVGFFCF